MSEEAPKITTLQKTPAAKNPKRVEQGKRLAAISGEAKARKKESCDTETQNILLIGGVFALGGALYYLKKRNTNDTTEESPAKPKPVQKEERRQPTEPMSMAMEFRAVPRKMYSMDD